MLYKENWQEAKKRFEALWHNEVVDRCCVAMTAPRKGSCYNESKYAKPSEHEELVKYFTDPERVLERYIAEFESTYYAGEALPILNPTWGDSGYAIYFNCNYKYSKQTAWFFPTITDWEKDALVFKAKPGFLEEHEKFIRYISEQAKGKFLLSSPDYIGNMDGLINLRGVENTLMDMVDEPEIFKSGVKTIGNAVKTAGGRFFDIITDACYGGSAFGWYNTWAAGRHNLVQCDFSAMISPQMFEEYVLPDLEESCNWLDCAVYHLDGRQQVRHLEMILSVKNLKMIQWTNVAGQPSVLDFIPFSKKFRKPVRDCCFSRIGNKPKCCLQSFRPKGSI